MNNCNGNLTKYDFETIVFDHNCQKDIMIKTLDIVKKFIQMNNLILVGGMAIDIAMRSKGSSLYPSNKFPDYDFISSEHHIDAYKLGELIADEFDGVSIINAFHVSSMRVRINFQEAADITYVPLNLIDKIPIIEYMGFKIVHPHFQMIDQHRALSLPFEKPPMETVLSRWEKDIKRYDLLNDLFPLKVANLSNEGEVKYNISIDILKGQCLSGYISLLYWMNKAKIDGYEPTDTLGWMNSYTEDDKKIGCTLPESAFYCILSDDYENLTKKIPGKVRHFNAILDKIPARKQIDNKEQKYHILDNKGDMRSAHLIDNINIHTSNLQEVMCYLITFGILYNDNLAMHTYIEAQKILFFATEKYTKTKDTKWLIYLPTTEVYGKFNEYESYKVAKEGIDAMLNKSEKKMIIPKNAYPTNSKPVKPELYNFDPTKSILFQFDGNEIIET
jgi:hypothetical protein